MASLKTLPAIKTPRFPLLFSLLMISFPAINLSQDPNSSSPNIASCQPRLMSLVPCVPFVQGTVPSPSEPCCDNLRQMYNQQPHCLCLLVNNSALSTIPINTTLAMQLPGLCNLKADISLCSGAPISPSMPSGSQVSLGSKANSTIAAPPMVSVGPGPSMIRSGNPKSSSSKLKSKDHFAVFAIIGLLIIPFMEEFY